MVASLMHPHAAPCDRSLLHHHCIIIASSLYHYRIIIASSFYRWWRNDDGAIRYLNHISIERSRTGGRPGGAGPPPVRPPDTCFVTAIGRWDYARHIPERLPRTRPYLWSDFRGGAQGVGDPPVRPWMAESDSGGMSLDNVAGMSGWSPGEQSAQQAAIGQILYSK